MKLCTIQKLLLLLVACHMWPNVRSQVSDLPNCGYLNAMNLVNQTHIAELTDFPWLARVGYETNRGIAYNCLAVLLTKQILLAPAECFVEEALNGAQVRWILLGDWNPRNPYIEQDCNAQGRCNPKPQLVEIAEIYIHPNYNNQTFSHNLALLKLARSINFSTHISPICLQGSTLTFDSSQTFQFAGFAVSGTFSHKLKGSTQIQEVERCREMLNSYNYTIAASSDPLYSMCGISNQTTPLLKGSPLMNVNIVNGKPKSYYLIGLLKYMSNQRNAIVFIEVVPHIKWIEQSIKQMTDTSTLVMPTIIPARLVRYEQYTVTIGETKVV